MAKADDAGETETVISAFGFTVTASEPETPDIAAEMLACPVNTLVTRPPDDTLATPVLDEDQVATEVTSFDVPSLYLAVAVSCCVCPASSVIVAGASAMDESVG